MYLNQIKHPICKNLIHNDCGYIEDFFNINDTDIPNTLCKTSAKSLGSLSIGHHNCIWIFIYYLQYKIHDNDPIGDDWVKVTIDDLNEFYIAGYDCFKRFCMDGLINRRQTSTTFSSKPYSPFEKFKISIKSYPTLFPAVTQQAIWDNYNRNSVSTACKQDV